MKCKKQFTTHTFHTLIQHVQCIISDSSKLHKQFLDFLTSINLYEYTSHKLPGKFARTQAIKKQRTAYLGLYTFFNIMYFWQTNTDWLKRKVVNKYMNLFFQSTHQGLLYTAELKHPAEQTGAHQSVEQKY